MRAKMESKTKLRFVVVSLMVLHLLTPAECIDAMHLSFLQNDRAYFIKPLQANTRPSNILQVRQQFALTHPSPFNAIKINYGPFQTQTPMNRDFLPATFINGTATNEIPDIDISAHIVDDIVTPEQPNVQVLCHASPIRTSDWRPSRKPVDLDYLNQKWCLQVHAQFSPLQKSTSVCILGGRRKTCTVDVHIPESWWNDPYYHRSDMFYSFYPITQNSECSSASTLLKSHTNKKDLKRFYVGEVTLDQSDTKYKEMKQDQHVLIYVPKKSVYPKSKFMGKVKLQAESNVRKFSVRIRTRAGVKVMDVIPRSPHKWKLEVETSKKKQVATVTATIRDEQFYAKSPVVQEIFDWVFEVEDFMHTSETSRIIWKIRYEPSGQITLGPVKQVRMTSRIHIDRQERYNIVPVLKVYEILNMAMLTGKRMAWPVEVYAVRSSGFADDITKLSQCWSSDVHVIKIAADCSQMFLDGSEVTGSTNVSFTIKHGAETRKVPLSVWVPEIPLGVYVSDAKLSQIKGWRAPDNHVSRKVRSAEPGKEDEEEGTEEILGSNEVDEVGCRIRYQQATVQVYTRFTLMDNGRVRYWLHRKAQLDITDFIKDRLRVSDPRVAKLDGVIVEGQAKGRTEVQVVSLAGRVIGAKEVRVNSDKVGVTRLDAVLVAGLGVEVAGPGDLPGTYRVGVVMEEKLRAKGQEGFLDISVEFSDGTSTPLHYINPNDYFLEMDTQAPSIVRFGPLMTADRPRVKAVNQGKGVVKLGFELGDTCRRKASVPLAESEVYIDVDFTAGGPGQWMNDGRWFENLPPSQWHVKPVPGKEDIVRMHFGPDPKPVGGTAKPKSKLAQVADITEEFIDPPENQVGFREAQKQRKGPSGGLAFTPLQIGIYALVALVCPAVFVMTSYCVVYAVRRQKGRLTRPADTVAASKDWVWIGSATLERNRVNTECSQALMPAADFNGNHNPSHPAAATALASTSNEPDSNNRISMCSRSTSTPRSSLRHSVPIAGTSTGGAVINSDEGSNRSSTVSEYEGEEINIRITTNPRADEQLETTWEPRDTHSDGTWEPRALGMEYDELMDYFDNLKESVA